MFENMPESMKAMLEVMTNLSPEDERQVLLSSTQKNMAECESGKELEIHQEFMKVLERLNDLKTHNTGFFLVLWLGADSTGDTHGVVDVGGHSSTMKICMTSIPAMLKDHLKQYKVCACPACILKAKAEAIAYMNISENQGDLNA